MLQDIFSIEWNFFKKFFVVDGSLGKTKYYAIRVEFQVKGSPHIRSVIWILNAPKLTLENIQEYTSLVDGIISAYLPDAQLTTELYDLVKTYQIQHHSKTCHKYKNEKCRFQCGRYFTDHTIIARPLEAKATLSCAKKKEILSERSRVLQVVSEYINDQLNPSKHNIYDHTREDYEKVKSTEEILDLLHISVDEYYYYLAISEDDNFQIHLRRPPNSCFVNNYFKIGLSAWQANMDIQPVFNEHNAIAYICEYLSKSEESCSYVIKQPLKISIENEENYEQMNAIAQTYAFNQECSVQEAVYHCLPELWLRRVFPGVIYANTNIPEKHCKIFAFPTRN